MINKIIKILLVFVFPIQLWSADVDIKNLNSLYLDSALMAGIFYPEITNITMNPMTKKISVTIILTDKQREAVQKLGITQRSLYLQMQKVKTEFRSHHLDLLLKQSSFTDTIDLAGLKNEFSIYTLVLRAGDKTRELEKRYKKRANSKRPTLTMNPKDSESLIKPRTYEFAPVEVLMIDQNLINTDEHKPELKNFPKEGLVLINIDVFADSLNLHSSEVDSKVMAMLINADGSSNFYKNPSSCRTIF